MVMKRNNMKTIQIIEQKSAINSLKKLQKQNNEAQMMDKH